IGDLLAGDINRDRALRRWIRALPGMQPHGDNDVCSVEVRLSAASLRDRLKSLFETDSSADSDGSEEKHIDLSEAGAAWHDLSATGSAATGDIAETPLGWEDVSENLRTLTRRAAEADARTELLRTIYRLRVTQARLLAEFIDSGDAVRRSIQRGL